MYLSEWASDQFSDVFQKNSFYEEFGEVFSPRADQALGDRLNEAQSSAEVLALARQAMSEFS